MSSPRQDIFRNNGTTILHLSEQQSYSNISKLTPSSEGRVQLHNDMISSSLRSTSFLRASGSVSRDDGDIIPNASNENNNGVDGGVIVLRLGGSKCTGVDGRG